MKKNLFLVIFLLSSFFFVNIHAQTINQIAFIDSEEILNAMPAKAIATQKLTDLNKSYKAELEVIQNDYNKKYADFITYQTSMGENIRLRRMQELKELEDGMREFIKLAQRDVEHQEQELLIPLRKQIKDAIKEVGIEQNLVCIYDLANPAIVFVTPDAMDITALVKRKLNIK